MKIIFLSFSEIYKSIRGFFIFYCFCVNSIRVSPGRQGLLPPRRTKYLIVSLMQAPIMCFLKLMKISYPPIIMWRNILWKISEIIFCRITYFLNCSLENFKSCQWFYPRNPKISNRMNTKPKVLDFRKLLLKKCQANVSLSHTISWKVFILPRVAELFIHKEKQRDCPLLGANKYTHIYIKYICVYILLLFICLRL